MGFIALNLTFQSFNVSNCGCLPSPGLLMNVSWMARCVEMILLITLFQTRILSLCNTEALQVAFCLVDTFFPSPDGSLSWCRHWRWWNICTSWPAAVSATQNQRVWDVRDLHISFSQLVSTKQSAAAFSNFPNADSWVLIKDSGHQGFLVVKIEAYWV